MPRNAPNFSAKQLLAIASLARGDTINNAAKQANVSEKTVDRWLQERQFKEAVKSATSTIYQQSIQRTVDATNSAIDCLVGIIHDPDASNRDKIAASREILSNAKLWNEQTKVKELDSLKDLVDAGWLDPEIIEIIGDKMDTMMSEIKEVFQMNVSN